MPFYLAFPDFGWNLCRTTHRGRLRWLILVYGGLRLNIMRRDISGFGVLCWVPYRLGDSPAGISTGCRDTRLVCNSICVWNVMVVHGSCAGHNTLHVPSSCLGPIICLVHACMYVWRRLESRDTNRPLLVLFSSHEAQSLRATAESAIFQSTGGCFSGPSSI